ncbi:MAG: sensor histidine kinase [Roseimicrobium sp.]
MMKLLPHTLRWRLLLWYGLLLLVVLLAFGFTAHHLERTERLRSVDQDLQQRLAAVVSALRARRLAPPLQSDEPPRPNVAFPPEVRALFGEDSGCYYAVWLRDREPMAKSKLAPAGLPRPAPGSPTVRLRDGHLREVFLFAAPADCVLVGRSMAQEERLIQFHAGLLAAAGGVLLVLGLVGGSWLVARAIQPIQGINETAARIAEGELTARIPIAVPESELGQLSGVLNATFAQLESAFAQQARFTADAAHELRTPVTVLLSETQGALARERSASEYRESLEACQRAGQRMRKLIGQLLALARLDAPKGHVKHEPCDLAALTSECLQLVAGLAAERSITIHRDLRQVSCPGEAEQLLQVITNLLTNAIYYAREGGTVRVGTQTLADRAVLYVADDGPGIAAEDLPHVFERFYRADKARTSAAGRLGLGLSIAQGIVAQHRGTIVAESEPGQGATFTVSLPSLG